MAALFALGRGLAVACTLYAAVGAAQAQSFQELENGPACIEQWVAHVSSVLNAYDGEAEFNSRKPWRINQYGLFVGTGISSAYEPDNWAEHGANRNQWMWDTYTSELEYPDWNNANFNAAGLKGLRWFVRDCAGGGGGGAAVPPPSPGGPGGSVPVGLDPSATCPDNFTMHRDSTLTIICYCAPGALTGGVWGTGVYTDDSSLCNAAVHAGAVGASGGMIVVHGAPGRDAYQGTSSNGVDSQNFTAHPWSFTFTGYTPPSAGGTSPIAAACPSTMTDLRGTGQARTCHCGPDTMGGGVWGTDFYTDDSSICAAALHAGVISTAGGTVTAVAAPGRISYQGSVRNGVESHDFAEWHGSFYFQR
jgi:hypothetical protein